MNFKKPVIVYTAESNIELHLIVELLLANGIEAHAVEDQSGVSLWAMGTISQFHQPNIWVEEVTAPQAAALIQEFEQRRRARNHATSNTPDIQVLCEECGKVTTFPSSQNGTTQDCGHCHAYVDVGDLPWDDDYGMAEE